MKSPRRSPELRKLLSTCEDLQQIRTRLSDPELAREARTRLRRQSQRKHDQLTRDLRAYQFRGPLARVVQTFPLAPEHFQILAVLLYRQTRCEDPALQGRLVLAAIFESAYDVLARADLLLPDAPLRASGLVVLEDDEENPDDVLEARFVLSEEALDGFRQEVAGRRSAARRPGRHDPYASNRELLVDLHVIQNLYQQRSDRVFSHDRWHRLHNTTYRPGRSLSMRIEAAWTRLRARLEATENAAKLPAMRLMREYALTEEEMVIIIHLLFKELYEGSAYADVADLLKLISRSETDLIQNRRIAAEGSSLLKHDILRLEPMIEGRSLTGESSLADWVVNYLFGSNVVEDIRADERIDWHVYLHQLEDTSGFYR
ncbi:MAG: hypothetical protein KDC87_15240, partial [Planctomycetes bacterium]|nr:hypothetical protein [Planctomycetota bacterium]